MATVRETTQCYPKEIDLGGGLVFPAPEPDHDRCPRGHTIKGVMGGWVCPCPCHRATPLIIPPETGSEVHQYDGGESGA